MWLEKILAGTALKKIIDSWQEPALRHLRKWRRGLLQSNKLQEDYSGENDLAVYRRYLDDLLRASVGRSDELDEVLEVARSQQSARLLIEGPSGFGKTTFFANLKDRLDNERAKIAWHLFSRNFHRDPSGDIERFDINLAEQLAWHTGRSIQTLRNRSSFVIDTLREPPEGLVLLLDALDETDTRDLYSRLPEKPKNGMKIILTARATGRDSHLEDLGLVREDFDCIINMPPLGEGDILKLLRKYKVADANVGRILRLTDGDPFFVRFLVEDISEGRVDEWDERRPPSLGLYLEKQFDQLTEDAGEVQARIMTQIVISPSPMPKSELIAIIPGLSPANFNKYFRPISRFFVSTPRGFIVCHSRFREFFVEQLGIEGGAV